MDFPITIEYGLSDWQILSRINGSADVTIGGSYIPATNNNIYIRIIDEDSGCPILPWLEVDLLENNKWRVEIKNIPEGGLYQLETINRTSPSKWIENGIRGQVISHFGVGDVYLIVGQSNASGTGLGTGVDKPILGVSNLKNEDHWELATHPLKDRHSPFLSFAKKIFYNTNIPIGLFDCAVGGVAIDRWLVSKIGDLYNRMLEVTRRFQITPKAVIFYQGESDADKELHCKYAKEFNEFVQNIRSDFDSENLEIYTFQLNAHLDCRIDWKEHDMHWDSIRETQRRLALTNHDVYVIPTIDIPMSDGIHNSRSGNITLGERLANYVLKYTYHKKIFATAPELESIILKSDTNISVKYKNIQSQIMVYHSDGAHVPLWVEDDLGNVDIENVTEVFDTVELKLARSCVGDVYVSCQTGARNKRYIQELATNIPVLTFYKVKASKKGD